jgi:hypothetical protein
MVWFKKSLKIRGNQNPYIEKEQTAQWPKEKGQRDKQRSTRHTYKTKDRVTHVALRRVWRYQRGNKNPYIKEEQTTQWPKEKGHATIYNTHT